MKGSHYNRHQGWPRFKENQTYYRTPSKQDAWQQRNSGLSGHSPAAPSPADSHADTQLSGSEVLEDTKPGSPRQGVVGSSSQRQSVRLGASRRGAYHMPLQLRRPWWWSRTQGPAKQWSPTARAYSSPTPTVLLFPGAAPGWPPPIPGLPWSFILTQRCAR